MIDLKVTNAMFELLRTVFDAERELSRESAEILTILIIARSR